MTTRRMPLLSILYAALLLTAAAGAHASPRRSMDEGHRRFERGDYSGAREAFEQAAEAAHERGDTGRMDPAAALYNVGKALFAQGAFDEAAAAFHSALGTADLALQQKIYFNRGNALVGESVEAEQTMDLEGAIELMQEATWMYERSMALDPGDLDPKINHELALARIEELERNLQEQQQQQDGDGEPDEEGDEGDDEQRDQPDDGEEGDQDGDPQERPDDRPEAPEEGDGEPEDDGDEGEPDGEPPPPRDAPRPPRESEAMTEEEAKILLNAIRDEEQAARQRHRIQVGQPEDVEKDW